ncbi:globin domain-containing protein [Luteolibacter sp. GHJ8]|uniref:Globin domain-containing protein n=1 Tax=Luteolibacter rhizosphaerae TaxID=2989719 RepID=A0ABT3FZD1_9BACT|nr:globin family protein [Luteolibacter rhizosphaerae]MCW1912599.1 globin domain-containing protein [Luteolibacter rhizosphaerae]
MLTADQIHRVRKSFIQVERQSHVAALVFYQRLFELDPSLRPLFKTDIELQARKLMEMLGAALSLLERPGELTSTLEDLGARHVAYGVKREHYATVGTALLAMLETVLARDFTAETRLAWTDLYALIAETMLRGAAHAAR